MDSGGIKIISDSDPPGIFPENVIAEPYVFAELYQCGRVQKSYCTGALLYEPCCCRITSLGVLREENRYSPINGCIYSGQFIVHA